MKQSPSQPPDSGRSLGDPPRPGIGAELEPQNLVASPSTGQSLAAAAPTGARGWRSWLGWLSLPALLATLIWGSLNSVVRLGLREIPALAFAPLRITTVAVVRLALLLLRGESFRLNRQDLGLLLLIGVVGTAGFNLCYAFALSLTTVANVGLILAMTPVFAALVAAGLRFERLTARRWGGIGLAVLGVALIIGLSGVSLRLGGLAGDGLMVCAAFVWGSYGVLSARLLRRHSPLKVTALASTFASGATWLVTLPAVLGHDWSQVGLAGTCAVFYGGVAASVGAMLLWIGVIKRRGASGTTVYMNLVPVWGLVFAALLVGGAIVLAGIWLASR